MQHERRVLAAWNLAVAHVAPLAGGLINTTFLVEAREGRFVLQKLHPIFAGEVNEDIEVVTTHLTARGMTTPRLVRTREGRLWIEDEGAWRMQTFVDGASVHSVESPARAASAGELVGRFHAALADLRHDFVFRRAGVHDTARHFALLDDAVHAHVGHADHAAVAHLRDELVAMRASLSPIDATTLPRRIAHGDLKVSNLLFGTDGRGVCLVDLDTLGEMPLPFELGDAWRSWCNPLGEDDVHAHLDLALLDAAWRAYASHMTPSPDERALLVTGVATIALELAARFARDVLDDRYFGWDAARFPSRSAHNLVRATSQTALARSVLAQRRAAESIVA